MSFYDDWAQCIREQGDESDYIDAFLKKKDYTTRVLNNGTNEQLAVFCKLLLDYKIEKIIDFIDENQKNELDASKIIQFSSFDNATTNIVKVLYNKDEGMTYPEIGRLLAGSVEINAATKYGENHSKLARDFNLVAISEQRPTVVKITNFGKCFAFLDEGEQNKILRMLGLRDPLIQNMIIKAKTEITYYSDECACLSESTKIRRRSNVRKLFELIFDKVDSSITDNIIW